MIGDDNSSASVVVAKKTLGRDLSKEARRKLEEGRRQLKMEGFKRRILKSQKAKSQKTEEIREYTAETMEQVMEITRRTSGVNAETRSIIAERDQAMQDLRNVETAFSDVHRKYERAKTVVENLNKNEELLRQRDEEIQHMIDSRDQKYEAFKQEAQQTIEVLYHDFQTRLAALENDNVRLTAQLRRTEMRAETLQSKLEQKQNENKQLNNLADELIGKSNGDL